MATYTTYFTDERCAECVRLGLDGKPIDAVAHRGRLMPAKGDTVVMITARRGVVYALASLQVEKIEEEIERLADFCPDYGDAVLMRTIVRGKALAPLRFDRPLTPLQLRQWAYESSTGPRTLNGDLERRGSVRAFARVTPETAAMLDRLLGSGPDPSSMTGSKVLEERLRDSPEDEPLAQVLADAWQADGDPRGELLSLELALRHQTDPEQVAKIDQRVSELARKARDVRKRPGGFPFRSVWGTREVFELDIRFNLDAGFVDGVLKGPGTWLEVEGISKLVFQMSRVPRQLEEQLEDLGGSPSWTDRPHGRTWEWRRKTLMPLDAMRPWLLDYPLEVTFSGRPLLPGTSTCVPLLTQPVWRGPRPMSHATFRFERGVSRSVHLRLRLPQGTAFGATVEARLLDRLGEDRFRLRRRTVTWGKDSERELQRPQEPRYTDVQPRQLLDPIYGSRQRDGPRSSFGRDPPRR